MARSSTDYPYVDATKPAVVEDVTSGVTSDVLNPGRIVLADPDVPGRFRPKPTPNPDPDPPGDGDDGDAPGDG